MPSTLVKTIGAANANTYVDLTDANAYFGDRLDAAKWNGATDDDKTRGLLMAAKQMQFENWLGDRVNSVQALAWPRIGVARVDGLSGGYGYGYGYSTDVYLTTEIPQPVKDSQCELALDLLSGISSGSAGGVIESFTLDELNVKLSSSQAAPVATSRAARLISALVAGNQLVRG